MPNPETSSASSGDIFGIVNTTQCGSFHVERAVAEGGFAVVYRALHGAFRAPVALKCLKMPTSLSATHRAEFLEKFRGEAELMFRLSASIPEVVRPLHVDHFIAPDGRFVPFIALEWLDGEPLSSVIDRRAGQGKPPVSLRRAIDLLAPIARCLHRAHSFPSPEGPIAVIHCDVKPDNLFVVENAGEPSLKILDFGVAKARSLATARAGGVTGSETNVFTPSYASPEQWVPQRFGQTGPWTDVYAFALSLLELILGRPPIEGEMHVMLAAALDETRRPTPRTVGIDVGERAERAFAQAVVVDPKSRTQSIEAFWSELERSLGIAPTLLRGPSSLLGPSLVEPNVPSSGKRSRALESEPPPPALELAIPDFGGYRPPPSSRLPSEPPQRPQPAAQPPDRSPSGARPRSAQLVSDIVLDTDPIICRVDDSSSRTTSNAMHSRLAPAVAARRAAKGEGVVLGVRPGQSPSAPILPSWLHTPLLLGLLAVLLTAADLYATSVTGARLAVEGVHAWWGAMALFAGAVLLALVRGLSR